MRVLVLPVGSHGDVHPLLGIAAAMRGRGHEVTVATNEHFEALVRRAGVGYLPTGTDAEFREGISDPEVWHPTKGFKRVMSWVTPLVGRTYELITRNFSPDDTVIVAAAISFGARVAQDKLGYRVATTQLQPAPIRTMYEHPKLPGMFLPRATPRWIKQAAWAMADRLIIDPVVGPGVNEFRASVGLGPVRRLLKDWWNSPDLTLGLWPAWFAPRQPDWPGQMKLTGFPLFDEGGITALPSELVEFLGKHPEPIAFTPGSAHVHAGEFFAESARACEMLGRPGLLLTRHGGQIPTRLPGNVLHVPYAPFSDLLPRCGALVHHGGIGTTAQALGAGCRQLVMPLSHDQPDNAARVRRLGVGGEVSPKGYRAAKVAGKLEGLLGSAAVTAACRAVAGRFEGMDALGAACGEIERLGEKRLSTNGH